MTDKYVFFINNTNDNSFSNIGVELFKIAISLSYSYNNKKRFVISNTIYLNILEAFINLKFELLDINKIKDNYTIINLDNNEIDYDDNNNCIIKIDYSFKSINEEVIDLLSTAILSNPRYLQQIYTKINDIMIFFNDYDINNYVCININKTNYNKSNYEKAYYNNFSDSKLLILTDDINWTIKNVNFTNINNIYIIENSFNYRFLNFILLSHFNKMIIEKDNYTSLWFSYIGKKNKDVILV